MSGVDDRIVSMRFDNAVFEQKLSDTIKSLDKLSQALKFSNAGKGMQDITAAANGVNLSTIANGVDHISSKFNAMTVIAVAALTRITHMAVDAGVKLVKSLTIEPILDGFREFETNMNSIQTILANTSSKGSTLDDVNRALNDLNHYSDQTIYNFSEMARNIGTFTAAGIDLDKSTAAIKGIANLAAVSGSNSQQASTAMYQLSQAMASGTVKLMDWNSVVNAGMGGEVFQKALFETGKQMKTISGVPMAMTFDQWKDSGNSFRGSLEKGWLTADVLTKTLQGFTGDLTKAQVMSMGYTSAQADEIVRMGTVAKAAATEVKTFTQLMGTIKEAVGSGWTQTFQILIGNFDESKKLFTDMNNAIGNMVSNSANARNELLQGWKDLGGRDKLIQGFKDALTAVGKVLHEVSSAFRDFFPKTTSGDLWNLTEAFANFTKALIPSRETLANIHQVFAGFFAALSIGWEVVKGVFSVFTQLFSVFAGSGVSGGVLGYAADFGSLIVKLQQALVEGGKIANFFDEINRYIRLASYVVKDFIGNFSGLLEGFNAATSIVRVSKDISGGFDSMSDAAGRVTGRFQGLIDFLNGVKRVLGEVWSYVSSWFGDLGNKIANLMRPGDFDAVVDTVNVGLLGGIALLLKKFLKNGLDFNFNMSVFDSVKKALDNLTGTLQAMQTNLKANALIKIAGAIGILTASVVVMSMIDSAALTKAMAAIAVGFGQLVVVMKLLDGMKISAGGAAKMNLLGTAMITFATAMGILSLAIKNLSSLSLSELAKGLGGVAVAMGIMVGAMQLMTMDTGGLIRAGVAMSAMAVSMRLMAEAVQAFGSMSWGDMAKGLVGVAVAIGTLTVALNFMPSGAMVAAGLAMIPLATGLTILAGATKLFSMMSWADMAQGLIGIGGALVVIAGAMQLMPLTLPITAAGLVLVAGALTIMAGAVALMGSMDFGSMAKGISGLAVMLGILVVAMNAMNSAVLGAASLVIISGALVVLTGVLKVLGGMSIAQLATGLGALAAVFVLLGAAGLLLAPLAPALIQLGLAMALMGGSFALLGAGALMIAKAFEVMAQAGVAGTKAFIAAIKLFISALPEFVAQFVSSLAEMAGDIGKSGALIVRIFSALLGDILDMVVRNVPKIAKALGEIITAGLTLIRTHFPELVETGGVILLSLMKGIEEHISEVVTAGVGIMTNFVAGLVENMPMIVGAAVTLITSFVSEVANRAAEIVAAGLGLLTNLLLGISQNIGMVIQAVASIITNFLAEIVVSTGRIIQAGVNMLIWLLSGIGNNLVKVTNAIGDLVVRFIGALGENTSKIVTAGLKVLTDMISGITNNLVKITDAVGLMITRFVGALGENATKIVTAGADALVKFINGISDNLQKIINAGKDLIIKFIQGIANASLEVTRAAADTLITFLNGLADQIEEKMPQILAAGRRVAKAIVEGIVDGIGNNAHLVMDKLMDMAHNAWNAVKGFFGIHSPSRLFMTAGQYLMEGMAIGIGDSSDMAANSAVQAAEHIVSSFYDKLSQATAGLPDMDLQPTITPVLDLTQVRAASRGLNGLLAVDTIVPEVSTDRARHIATTTELANDGVSDGSTPEVRDVTFNQYNNSPTALSTGDIYRNTKSQIAVAKEELGI